MDLNDMVFAVLKNVVLAQVLFKRGKDYEAEKLMVDLIEMCCMVQDFHPERFEGPIKRFRIFTMSKEVLRLIEDEGVTRAVAQEYAAFATNDFFRKRFSRLVEDLVNKDTGKLKTTGVEAFMKFYQFMMLCSKFYRRIEIQGIHFLHCTNIKCHSRVSVYMYTITSARVIHSVTGDENIQELIKFLLQEYPFFAKYVIQKQDGSYQIKRWSSIKS